MKELIVHWEVEDGYVGKSSPQKTKIPFSEFEDDMTEEDIADVINESIQTDFENKITWFVQREEGIAELEADLKRRREE